MLKRTDIDLKYRDKYLKYVLFAYRDTPNCITGFTLFELLFGCQVKGPLDLLHDSSDSEKMNVSEWLIDVKTRLAEIAQLVSTRETKAKIKMKQFYDTCRGARIGF